MARAAFSQLDNKSVRSQFNILLSGKCYMYLIVFKKLLVYEQNTNSQIVVKSIKEKRIIIIIINENCQTTGKKIKKKEKD